MQKIQWQKDTRWQEFSTLDGREYLFEAFWNTRDEAWYLSVTAENGASLILDKKLVLGINMLAHCYKPEKPNGVLFAWTQKQGVTTITRDNIGTDVELYYLSNDEANEVLSQAS